MCQTEGVKKWESIILSEKGNMGIHSFIHSFDDTKDGEKKRWENGEKSNNVVVGF